MVLAVSILSYGLSGASFAQEPELPLSIETDSPIYAQGNTIVISGTIKTLDTNLMPDVTLIIVNPDGTIVGIQQISPVAGEGESGTFEMEMVADGPLWTKGGDYEIRAQYGAQKITGTFEFAGGSGSAPPPPPPEPEPEPISQTEKLILASFVDTTKDPQIYVDRYNTESSYKKWFDDNYPEYSSIYEAVGLEEPVELAPFVDPNLDPQYYIDRYNSEPQYQAWFDSNFPDMTIYEAVGLNEPEIKEPEFGECGIGTQLIDGKCQIIKQSQGGGCLIATAAYGSELAPQVQFLREVRDNTLLSTESGTSFMTGFNSLYYSFSPTVADLERESPVFREAVKLFITPMLSTLSIMTLADEGSESSVLGLGISVIALNLGMYIAAPAIIGFKVRAHLKSRK